MKLKTMSDKDRLYKMSIVDTETMCWNWIGTLKGSDKLRQYGSITVGSRLDGTRKQMSAHRFSYRVFNGEIPIGLFVCHKCDNPKCINPKHLFLGTRQDNIDDRESKGRNKTKTGEDSNLSKLNKTQVLLIRQLRQDGVPRKDIQKQLNIPYSQIKSILSYKSWKEIIPPKP